MSITTKAFTIGSIVLSGAAFGVGEHAGHGTHWGYVGDIGPERWVSLQPEFGGCAGKNQSPIDMARPIAARLQPVQFSYKEGGYEVINNGHTIQVNYEAGSSITIDDTLFDLKQFHFHSPSENQIAGKSFPLEAHLVHADKNGNLAVVAVMFDEGKSNPVLAAVWARMPKAEGDKEGLSTKVAAVGLLPAGQDNYRYNGSLTTPPCTEGVRWLVMKESMTATKGEIDTLRGTLGFANNRPVQAINARPVLE